MLQGLSSWKLFNIRDAPSCIGTLIQLQVLPAAPQRIPSPSLVVGYLNDLYGFSPTNITWASLVATSPPTARVHMGFTATPDGMLYVFGGYDGGGGRVCGGG